MPVTRRADDRRNVTSVVFCRPEAVAPNFQRRKPDPFASRRAPIVEIQTRVIHEDGNPAAYQHGHKKEIEEMAAADPQRKSVRTGKVVRIHLGDSCDVGDAFQRELDPGCADRAGNHNSDSNQNRRPDPDSESTVGRVMHRPVRGVTRNREFWTWR